MRLSSFFLPDEMATAAFLFWTLFESCAIFRLFLFRIIFKPFSTYSLPSCGPRNIPVLGTGSYRSVLFIWNKNRKKKTGSFLSPAEHTKSNTVLENSKSSSPTPTSVPACATDSF